MSIPNLADMKAMLADVGMSVEVLSPMELAAAMNEWPACPPRTDVDVPHCPDCSGIIGETGIV